MLLAIAAQAAETRLDVITGRVLVTTAADRQMAGAAEKLTIDSFGRLYRDARPSPSGTKHASTTILLVTGGRIILEDGAVVAAGYQAGISGDDSSSRKITILPAGKKNVSRLSRLLATRAERNTRRVTARDRASIVRATALSAAKLEALDVDWILNQTSTTARLAGRPLSDFARLLKELSGVISRLNVAYVLDDIHTAEDGTAEAKYVAAIEAVSKGSLFQPVSLAGTGHVIYEKQGATWVVKDASVVAFTFDSVLLPPVFVKLKDMVITKKW